jgi:hypothetical protein
MFIRGILEGQNLRIKPHTLDKLRKNVLRATETTEVAVLRKVYMNMATCAQKVLIHKDLISSLFCENVHLVYQKINETKSFLDFAVQGSRF